ncbi:MAG: PD40 domain-containing protein [Myxococcales bacterium]|nr:PD40 domain-containing protein [Myxococcales bacterium]
MRRLALLACTLTALGCQCDRPPSVDGDGGDGDGGDGDGGRLEDGGVSGCVQGATALSITPANQTVSIGSGASQTIQFTATATMADGSSLDVTSRVNWSVKRSDDTPPGSITPQGLYSPPSAGGMVTVTASDGCLSAQATLTLVLQAVFKDPGPAVTARFGGTVVTGDANRSPTIVYPNTETRFPRNIYKVLFQWRKGGNDWFRLTFEGEFSKTVVYSDGAHPQCAAANPPAGCYEADTQSWLAIAGSNAGGVVTLTVDGVGPGDPKVYRAATIRIGFSKRDVKGAIFYWSTTAAGIRRAAVSDALPEDYVVAKPVATVLPNNGGTVGCVACHTVSRSGKKIFAGTKTSTATGEFVYDVTLVPPPIPIITTQISNANKGFGTFSPDDKRVVATVGNTLAEFDAQTGQKIANLSPPAATNPDWSPTGAELAYSNKAGDSPAGAGLEVISYDGGWGATRPLAPANGLSNLFPSYSPDGKLVAYARGLGGHGDKTFQLHLIQADGAGQPVELVTANRHVNNAVGDGQHENTMPTWAPPGDLDWVAFNSRRPYGVVYPNGGVQQIWVSAIDRAKWDGGADPSHPAFRFAFQGLNENNHRAYWTLDVRFPEDAGIPDAGPPPDAGACLNDGDACDQTSGPSCCFPLVCDVGADGGTVCKSITVN